MIQRIITYKHLFPVTDKQYNEILRVHEQDGETTDKQIHGDCQCSRA